ncbi:hypothetical protein [Caballeronia sp. LZ034LL]|uniref:hypothetical protein n=1 Tax=Caballeronia sp. LZ034LL TaxID=3038567 RepID=UPI0028544279|nr:hypothetical protein [Caballeronia sp. LZ034LL]MDR5839366.1 hypothetical protein [Caballeronia sp. LZ034LL]
MSYPQNILEIQILLDAHVLGKFQPRGISQQHDAAVERLLSEGMVQLSPADGSVTTSLKGQFWVDHLCTIPYPVTTFAIPKEPA